MSTCHYCNERCHDLDAHECSTEAIGVVLDDLRRKLEAMTEQRNALADALWSAEDQWGGDYLWKKWGLSRHLTKDLKDLLGKAI